MIVQVFCCVVIVAVVVDNKAFFLLINYSVISMMVKIDIEKKIQQSFI